MHHKYFPPTPSSTRVRAAVTLATIALFASIAAPTASAALGDLSIVSRADGTTGALGDDTSYTNVRTTSADGRYVVFMSYASNIGPTTAPRHVYRRDTQTGATVLVSRANGLAGAAGDDASFAAAVSADGNRVAFASGANNLTGDGYNTAYTHIFVRDIASGTTTLVSRASNGTVPNQSSISPVISGDGKIVAFQSSASNLDATVVDNNSTVDVYVRDLAASTTRLVSKSTAGTIGNGLTGTGDISFDGRFVTMDSEADNLGGTFTGSGQVYVRDRALGTTTLVSQATGNANVGGDAEAYNSTITDDGNLVFLTSRSSNLVAGMPANRFLGFIRNLSAATTTMVTRSSSGEVPNADVDEGSIAVDGRSVAFASTATNVDGPPASVRQAFDTDLTTGVTTLVSRVGRDGAPASGAVTEPTFGRSTNFVVFSSLATNLVPGPTGTVDQVFIRDVRVVDPISQVAVSGKRFTATLRRSRFAVKVNTTNGPTGIAGSATIRVSKKIARSGKIVVRYKLRTIAADRSSHKLTFKLSKRQNRSVLRALSSKRKRLKITVALVASKPGSQGTARISGKLRR